MKACILSTKLPALALAAVSLVLMALPVNADTTDVLRDKAADVSPGAAGRERKQVPDPDALYMAGPHQDLECTRCHRELEEGEGDGESVSGDSIALCRTCHKVNHLHPMGEDLPVQAIDGDTFSLPLGKGILDGRVVCQTCHVIHAREDAPHLLRGGTGTYESVRNSLCFSCHTDHFSGKTPHTEGKPGCRFCHTEQPQEKESAPARPDLLLQAACNTCHPNFHPSHFAGIDPFLDGAIRQRAEEAGIFFAGDQIVCTSCHDPHAKKTVKFRLRSDYFALCVDSRSINPHWNNYLCLSCHQGKPAKGKGNAPLRENGDKNLVCNRCHHSEYARPDIHPVDVIPSSHIRIPADMPLQDEKLSCETCHDSLLQMGDSRKEFMLQRNPNFLRKTQVKRNSYCFLCHLEETYKRLNPHNQLDAEGKVDEETCLFCHAAIPDVNFIGPEKVSFIIHNPDEYCVGCHHGFSEKHPAGVPHLRVPSEKILAAIQTSVQRIGVELPLFERKIVCATCHNPHQEGVIKISAAATGSQRENKLRLMPGRRQCTGCHWDK